MKNFSSFQERLKLLIEKLGLSIKDFAKATGIPYRTVQYYLSGKTIPGADKLEKMCAKFGININWLLTGEGEMFIKKEKPEPSPKAQPEDLPPELQKALSHPTIRHIALMLSEMPEEDIREILKRVEEKATLKKLLQKVQELERKVSNK